MATTAQQAYDAIKKLEANNTFPLPAPNKTVHVGNFDAATGKFKYAIKTVTITETEKSATGKPVILKSTAGEIKLANVVNLRLQFSVTNPKGTFTVAVAGIEVSAAAGGRSVTVDVGLSQSVRTPDGKISTVDGFIRSGTVEALLQFRIIRLPMVTGGAFTLPAVPIALVYAPPPGSQNKNFAEYSSMNASSRKISTSMSSGTTKKVGDAYSTTEFIDKISGLASNVQSLSLIHI